MKWRLVFSVLSAMGMAIIYGLKVNLSVNIVAMVNLTSPINSDEQQETNGTEDGPSAVTCHNDTVLMPHQDSEQNGVYLWSETEQGLVLGSYFWGYLVTQIPGGRLSEQFGGKVVLLLGVVFNIIPTLLSPLFSDYGYQYLIFLRVIEGLAAGVTFPAMNVLIAKWSPKEERSMTAAICFGGTAIGTVISLLSSGFIAKSLGWKAVFYLHGGLSCIWCIFWIIFVTDSPDGNKFVSDDEKELIKKSIHSSKSQIDDKIKKLPVPWKSILTSVPFWALIISHILNNFGWYMLLVELPSFLNKGLGFDIQQNAGLSCIPFLCNWIFSLIYSNRLDWARQKGCLSTTSARKLSVGIASLIPAACLLGVPFAQCEKSTVVVLMIVATTFYGAMFSGVFSNHVDLASNYSGVLMGISNMAATIPGFVVPLFVGYLTHHQSGIGGWHIVFYTTAALLLLEFLIFSTLATGEEQDWNNIPAKNIKLGEMPANKDGTEEELKELKA